MKIKILLTVALLQLSPLALAALPDWFRNLFQVQPKNYGAWECLSCHTPSSTTSPVQVLPDDIQAFIRYINPQIHNDAGEKVHRWIENSPITVCNANDCMTFIFKTAIGGWLPITGTFSRQFVTKVKIPKADSTLLYPNGGGGVAAINPIGVAPDFLSGLWSIRLFSNTPSSWRTPSITIVQEGTSTTFIGSPYQFPDAIQPDLGNRLQWSPESYGLDPWAVGGHCYHESFCDSAQ